MKNGYVLYAEFQLGMTGGFFTNLFKAIAVADGGNLARIEQGFPECVEAYKTFTREGLAVFTAKAPQHPSIDAFVKVY